MAISVFRSRLSAPPSAAGVRHVLLVSFDRLNLTAYPPAALDPKPVLLFVESEAYARTLPHHKQKLTYILSAQRHFAIACQAAGYEVMYRQDKGTVAAIAAACLTDYPQATLHYLTPSEWDTRQAMGEMAKPWGDRAIEYPDPFFMADLGKYRPQIAKTYRLETFYRDLRRETGYLMAADGKPVGGRWNYDKENRKKLPKSLAIPPIPAIAPDDITREVMAYVEHAFPHHLGSTQDFAYAVTRSQALDLAWCFMAERLPQFGPYEDAIRYGEPFLFHSVLSIYLNNGLLLPRELCEMAIAQYEAGHAPLASVEGFVRQILGWREYVRVYYEATMPAARSSNHFGFTHPLPQAYWDGQTELACLRDAIGYVLNHAYSHHIQRLMVLSNFSNLTLTDPRQLNAWFWLAYADAYEWVELPNVLGMATFADGGILASKPYVSGGNYIHTMSDCCQHCVYDVKQRLGDRACPLNYLYWNFVDRHRQDFRENGRVSLAVKTFDAKPDSEKQAIREAAAAFIERLPRSAHAPSS